MTIGELKAIIDSIHELHGPHMRANFAYQKSAGRTGLDGVSGYRVYVGILPSVIFNVGHPRGVEEA